MSVITINKSKQKLDLSNEKIERLIIKGDGNIISGLKMYNLGDKALQITGNNNVIKESTFIGNDGNQCIYIKGTYNRITNCLFEKIEEKGCLIAIVINKKYPSYTLIDKNNFRECLKSFDNGAEIIRIGDSKTSLYDGKCIIFNNFFSRCNREIELISVKSCKNIICYNNIMDCESGITLRHGRDNLVSYNYIYGTNDKCLGIRICDTGHIIKNNVIEGIYGKDNPFRSPIGIMCGEEKHKLNGYAPVKNIKIIDNSILGCEVGFSLGIDNKRGKQVKPSNINIFNNNVVKCIKEINENEKCLGLEKSIINNKILEKDIKIPIFKTPDFDDMNINQFYLSLKIDKKTEKKDNKKQEPKKKIVKKKPKYNFDEILEHIEDIVEENENNGDCLKCSDLINEMNEMKKDFENTIKELTDENKLLKDFYEKVKNKIKI